MLIAVRAGEGPDIAQAEYSQLPSYVSAGPVIAFVLILQRFWRLDLVYGSIK